MENNKGITITIVVKRDRLGAFEKTVCGDIEWCFDNLAGRGHYQSQTSCIR